MQKEKEKDRVGPKKEGEEPIEDSSQDGDVSHSGKADDLLAKAKKAKDEVEEYRKRSREREEKLEEDASQVMKQHEQEGGE